MTFAKDLRSAVVEDGISYLTGLAPLTVSLLGYPLAVPILTSTLNAVRREIKKRTRLVYVDWDLSNWSTFYHEESVHSLELPRGYQRFRLPQVIIHENRSGLSITKYGLRFTLASRPFALTPEVAARTAKVFPRVLRRFSRKRNSSNEECVRLLSIHEDGRMLTLNVQCASYVDYLRTNLLLDYSRDGKQSLRTMLHSKGKLEPLAKSALANLLGINVLLFTADGSLIVQKRSRKVAFRARELAPSSSGTVSYADAEQSGLNPILPITIMRETMEELGIPNDKVTQSNLTYLGTTRELIRGGEPEMFFFVRTDLSEQQVVEDAGLATFKWEVDKIQTLHLGKIAFENLNTPDKIHEFRSRVDELLDKIWSNASLPLLTALALWIRHRTGQNKAGANP